MHWLPKRQGVRANARGKKVWQDRLIRSFELLHRARLVLDFPGLSMLELDSCGDPAAPAYLDTVFMLASSPKPGELLDPRVSVGFR